MTLTGPLIIGAWRAIPARAYWATFLFGLGLFAYHQIIRWDINDPFSWVLSILLRDQVNAFALLFCVAVADRIASGDGRRRRPYVIAVIVAVAIGATVASMYMYIEPRTILRVVYWQIENLLLMTAAVLVYLDRRHARAALARRHAAELARVHASKRTLESRLQAMQARVEPKFLFDTLAQLKQLYESNPAAAERMLEELIAYLRAAMPRMRDTSSTVAQEIELVRAYLAIARIRLHDALDVRIDVPADANDARMPPMMLLPLVGRVVMQGHAPYRHERVSIGVSLNAGRLRLVVGDTGAAFGSGTDEDGIAGIRDRLSALYGDNAQLTLRSGDAEGTEAVVEVPYEPVAAT